jgi:hypothetical protein
MWQHGAIPMLPQVFLTFTQFLRTGFGGKNAKASLLLLDWFSALRPPVSLFKRFFRQTYTDGAWVGFEDKKQNTRREKPPTNSVEGSRSKFGLE